MLDYFSSLRGKVALITGAAQGIGAGIAKTFAGHGIKVVINDIVAEAGEKTTAAIRAEGGEVTFNKADVSKPGEVRRLVEDTVATYGRIDIVVNNAYWSIVKDATRLEEDEWDLGMAVMLKSAYLSAKHAIPHMLKQGGGGSIVNIASVHALLTVPRYPIYAAAKAGLMHMTRQMAIDGGPHGIRVNAICPGAIQNRPDPPNYVPPRFGSIPLRRRGQPAEIAAGALFLVSEMGSYVNGHALVIDGGMSVQLPDIVPWSGGKLAFTDEPDS